MHPRRTVFGLAVTALALTATTPTKAHAQYATSATDAMSATRVVLQRKGYEVVRVVQNGDAQVIYYRRVDQRGSAMERMVIRTVERRVVFEGVPSGLLEDIDQELKL
jgi:hypothetical protein